MWDISFSEVVSKVSNIGNSLKIPKGVAKGGHTIPAKNVGREQVTGPFQLHDSMELKFVNVSDSESKTKFKRLRDFWQAKAEPVISANNLPRCHSLCETMVKRPKFCNFCPKMTKCLSQV